MKNKTIVWIILSASFVILSAVLIMIPFEKSPAFWISYAFTVLAFASQIPIWNVGFKNNESLKSKFLGIPLVYIGTVYLIIQTLTTILFRFITVQCWISLTVSAVLLGITGIFLLSSQIAKKEISRIEDKVNKKVGFIRQTQLAVELLANTEKDAATKKALEALAEKIRFSDPMSNDQVIPIEISIQKKTDALKNTDSKLVVIGEIDSLLTERNSKIKTF